MRQCDASCPAGATSIVIDESLHNNGSGSFSLLTPPDLSYRDDGGRVLRAASWGFDGRPIYQDTSYDALGRKSVVDRPRFTADPVYVDTAFQLYDDRDRVLQSATYDDSGNAATTKVAYSGRQKTITNPLGYTMVEVSDALGLLATSTDANSQVTTYGREPFGNLNQVQDPLGNVVSMSYDTLGRRTQLADPDLGVVRDVYDPAGRLVQTQSPLEYAAGSKTSMTYDLLDRMTSRLGGSEHGTWQYDTAAHGVGELAQEQTLLGLGAVDFSRAYSYDSLSRLSTVTSTGDTGGSTYTTTTTYDSWGRPSARQDLRSGGTAKTFTTAYNAMGFAQTLTNASGVVLWTATTLDAADRETQASYGCWRRPWLDPGRRPRGDPGRQ